MYCLKCGKQFKNKLDFVNHLETCNCKYIRASCGTVFKKYLYFIKHINECHVMKLYRSKCKYCGNIYTKRGIAYLKHIKLCEKQISNEHKEYKTKRTYRYCKCLIIFQDRKTLYTHHTANHQRGRGKCCILFHGEIIQLHGKTNMVRLSILN